MEKPTIPTLPVRQVTRKKIFAMRLTDRERAEIEALAKQLKLPASYMARHFILVWTADSSHPSLMDDSPRTATTGTSQTF